MHFPLFVGVQCLSLLCYSLLCGHSSFAFILKKKWKLAAVLLLSNKCIVTVKVMWLFLTVPWVGLQYVTVVFPDHTHLLFVQIMALEPKLDLPPGGHALYREMWSNILVWNHKAENLDIWCEHHLAHLYQVCSNYAPWSKKCLFSVRTLYSWRTRIWKNINTITKYGKKFYQLHVAQWQLLRSLNNLENESFRNIEKLHN